MAKVPFNIESYQKYFDVNSFWKTLIKSAKKIGRVPVRQALILYYMYQDGLNLQDKLLVLGALGYLILPFDFIPDAIPLLGWGDDAAAIAYVWNKLKDKATPQIIAKAEAKVKEWFQDNDCKYQS